MIIAESMDHRMQDLFATIGIDAAVGEPAENLDVMERAYLKGAIASGASTCNHK